MESGSSTVGTNGQQDQELVRWAHESNSPHSPHSFHHSAAAPRPAETPIAIVTKGIFGTMAMPHHHDPGGASNASKRK